MPPDEQPPAGVAPQPGFLTTHWNVVLTARDSASPQSASALETLCRTYWYPLYAYVRRQGFAPEDAQDLTQSFFARLLEKHYLDAVTQEKGRFRSFLLSSLRHFISDQLDRAHAAKRGGTRPHLTLDIAMAETLFSRELSDQKTPERLFDRNWALAILDQAQARLREECAAAGKLELYEAIGPNESSDRIEGYEELAARLRLSESALKSAAFRLRQRYRALIRGEVAQTLSNLGELDEEMRHLLAALTE